MTKPDYIMELDGLDHVGMNVTDLKRSVEWYKHVLGFRVLHDWPTTALVGRGSIRLGLFWRPDATVRPDTDKDIVIQHVAFLVDGDKFGDARQELIDKGIAIEEQDNGVGYCVFFCDPDGHLLEFITYHPTKELTKTDPATHGHAHVLPCPCSRSSLPHKL